MTELLWVAKGERLTARRGYRSGYYKRKLHMKVGTVVLRVPQDRRRSILYQGD
ncbi:MAG: transposase [Gammaproteobacteria bacterium]|nr:transposase [Gammaproteobacteria bacterium]